MTDWNAIEAEVEQLEEQATGVTATVNPGMSVVFHWDCEEATASCTATGMANHGLEFFRHRPTDDGKMRVEWLPVSED